MAQDIIEGIATEVVPTNRTDLMISNNVITAQRCAVQRDLSKIQKDIQSLAKMAGHKWRYSIPFKDRKKGTTTYVRGATVKLAMDVARLYGNCELSCPVEENEDNWIFHATFVDYETGFKLTRPFRQNRAQGSGNFETNRQQDNAFLIGASKALRNVVNNALPTLVEYAYEEGGDTKHEDVSKNPDKYRKGIESRASELNIPIDRIEKFIGRRLPKFTTHDIVNVVETLIGVQDGMLAADDAFVENTVVQSPEPSLISQEVKESEKKPPKSTTRKKTKNTEKVEQAEPEVNQLPPHDPETGEIIEESENVGEAAEEFSDIFGDDA